MDVVDRINALCERDKTNKNAVEKACKLSHGAIEKWRNHSPKISGIGAVADYFNVSVEYLMTGNAINAASPLMELTAEEWDLLRKFRALDADARRVLGATLDALYAPIEKKDAPAKTA